jgi:hypothetical protein
MAVGGRRVFAFPSIEWMVDMRQKSEIASVYAGLEAHAILSDIIASLFGLFSGKL